MKQNIPTWFLLAALKVLCKMCLMLRADMSANLQEEKENGARCGIALKIFAHRCAHMQIFPCLAFFLESYYRGGTLGKYLVEMCISLWACQIKKIPILALCRSFLRRLRWCCRKSLPWTLNVLANWLSAPTSSDMMRMIEDVSISPPPPPPMSCVFVFFKGASFPWEAGWGICRGALLSTVSL